MAMRGETFRFWAPVAVLSVFAAVVSQKMVRAHVDPEVGLLTYSGTRIIPGIRGAIYDSCESQRHLLARSTPVWEYHLDPVALTNAVVKRKGDPPRPRNAILKTISKALSIDFARLEKMADDSARRYQFLARSTDSKAHETLSNSSLVKGVAIETRRVRRYPQGRLLSHVIGSVNANADGSAGIEQKYNSALCGVDGHVTYMKDALGRELYDRPPLERSEAIPGCDVYLTVDSNIQSETEKALDEGIAEFGAGSGWAIVMDSRTGAILAMASRPDFDPLGFGKAPDSAKLNRACSFVYEPGSVMKTITVAAALDAGRARPETKYRTNRDDPDYYKLPGDGTHVWPERMTVTDALVHSSNIVIGKLGWDIGRELLHGYMKKFGFGAKTGIELPGEETGILPDWRKWDKASWSRAPIGQYVAVTALQLAGAYQAIANDGVRMRPYIVERIVDGYGSEKYRHEPMELGRPIKASTARTLRGMMTGVATPDGTARRAAVKGYTIAGKTGTAQKSAGRAGYIPGLYRATFCGIVPAGEPRLVILVTLDFDERRKFHQGGNSSAPVFRKIAEKTLKYLMIPPDKPDELLEEPGWE